MDTLNLAIRAVQQNHYNDAKLCYFDAIMFDKEKKTIDRHEYDDKSPTGLTMLLISYSTCRMITPNGCNIRISKTMNLSYLSFQALHSLESYRVHKDHCNESKVSCSVGRFESNVSSDLLNY